ncbi:MAG TPA: hypothetical protein VFE36_16695 [Candidatus Baltobacteraceae bacterium]|nr:hypothetical protein [Candidatus Baltobacteraceae bacterium]
MPADQTGIILLVTGALTACAVVAVFAPGLTLNLLFGGDDADSRTKLVARHWALLLAIVGAMLLYAAYHPEVRAPIMIAATVEKFAIGGLIGLSGFRTRPLAMTVALADTLMAVTYVALLIGAP